MAFVNQQPRGLTGITDFKTHLGPGYYNSCISSMSQKSHSYAPFLSTSKREGINFEKSKILVSGSKNTKSESALKQTGKEAQEFKQAIQMIKPNSYFMSKVNRFQNKIDNSLGPGYYTQQQDKVNKKKLYDEVKNKKNKYKAILENIQQKCQHVPTIPDNKLKYGYTQNKQKMLIPIQPSKQKIVPKDLTVKPQIIKPSKSQHFSNVQQKIILYTKEILKDQDRTNEQTRQTTRQSKGNLRKRFLKNSSSQIVKHYTQNLEYPGPGYYQLPEKKIRKSQKFQFFGSSCKRFYNECNQITEPKQFYSVDRTNNKVLLKQTFGKEKRQIFQVPQHQIQNPGPTSYDFPIISKKNPNTIIGREERFKIVRQEVPPPGLYYVDPIKQNQTNKSFHVNKEIKPTKSRIKIYNYKQNIGPLTYDLSCLELSSKYKKSAPKAPFGSKDQRFATRKSQLETNTSICSPKQQKSKKQEYSNLSFQSSSPRFVYKGNNESVSPWSYNNPNPSFLKQSYNIKYR